MDAVWGQIRKEQQQLRDNPNLTGSHVVCDGVTASSKSLRVVSGDTPQPYGAVEHGREAEMVLFSASEPIGVSLQPGRAVPCRPPRQP